MNNGLQLSGVTTPLSLRERQGRGSYKIYVAGHKGLVGSAIWRNLMDRGYTNLVGRTHAELDLTDQVAVKQFFDEEQPDGSPDEFANTYEQGHHDASIHTDVQPLGRHEESAFASSQLKWHEEEHVSEKAGEGQDEDALQVVGIRIHHQKDEVDFKGGDHAAGEFRCHGADECLGVLFVKRGNLDVDVVEFLAMLFHESCRPSSYKWHMAEDVHHTDGQAFLVAGHEKPDAERAERGDGGEHHSDGDAHLLCGHIEHDGKQPEPEVAEDVSHGKEDDGGRCLFCSHLGFQCHDAVGLSAHQPAGSGIVERKARDGDFV